MQSGQRQISIQSVEPMNKLALILAMVLLPTALFAQAQITVTGSVSGATSGTVTFSLSPWVSSVQYYVPNGPVIASQNQLCGINSGGQVKNVALSGPCMIWGNDIITPGNTTYTVIFAPNGRITQTVPQEQLTGSAYNLSAPVFAPVVKIVPQYQTITTSPIAVNLVPAAPHTFTVGQNGNPYSAGYFDQLFLTGSFNPSSISATTATFTTLAVGSAAQMTVDSAGNITKIRNVSTNWPTANASGCLSNDGSGNFSYITCVVGGVTGSGTTGTIPIWTGSGAIGNSLLTQTSTTSIQANVPNFVIGASSLADAAEHLDVIGRIRSRSATPGVPASGAGVDMYYNPSGTPKGSILSVDWSAGTMQTIGIAGSSISFQVGAVPGSLTAFQQMTQDGAFDVINSAAAVSAANHGRLKYDSGSQTFQVSLNGGAYTPLNTGSGSGGWTRTSGLIVPSTLSDIVQTGSSTAFSSSPYAPQLVSIATTTFQNVDVAYGTGHLAQHVIAHSNGTQGSPSGTLSGDILGQLAFSGENANGIGLDGPPGSAVIAGIATANWTSGPTSDPSKLSFYTTPSGSAVFIDRLDILDTGQLLIDPTSSLAGGTAGIQFAQAGNGVGFATFEAITSDAGDSELDLYVKRSAARTLAFKLDGADSTTQSGLILLVNGSGTRVLFGSCTVASGTHSCLYVP